MPVREDEPDVFALVQHGPVLAVIAADDSHVPARLVRHEEEAAAGQQLLALAGDVVLRERLEQAERRGADVQSYSTRSGPMSAAACP